jgi:hypothetical protein
MPVVPVFNDSVTQMIMSKKSSVKTNDRIIDSRIILKNPLCAPFAVKRVGWDSMGLAVSNRRHAPSRQEFDDRFHLAADMELEADTLYVGPDSGHRETQLIRHLFVDISRSQ